MVKRSLLGVPFLRHLFRRLSECLFELAGPSTRSTLMALVEPMFMDLLRTALIGSLDTVPVVTAPPLSAVPLVGPLVDLPLFDVVTQHAQDIVLESLLAAISASLCSTAERETFLCTLRSSLLAPK